MRKLRKMNRPKHLNPIKLRKMKRIEYNNLGTPLKEIYNTPNHRLKNAWTNLLLGINFTKLVTIQPVWNKFEFEDKMLALKNCFGINNVFYSIEANRDDKYFHMHLMLDQDSGSRESLAKALKIRKDRITYYEPISYKDKVSKYIRKHMRGDQIHYNIY
ncbi:hypothetical protein N9596_06500 [Flavobacteriaceae bacterium]|nr:hypothetical protein [Flavobacteriaceae bacterium]